MTVTFEETVRRTCKFRDPRPITSGRLQATMSCRREKLGYAVAEDRPGYLNLEQADVDGEYIKCTCQQTCDERRRNSLAQPHVGRYRLASFLTC